MIFFLQISTHLPPLVYSMVDIAIKETRNRMIALIGCVQSTNKADVKEEPQHEL